MHRQETGTIHGAILLSFLGGAAGLAHQVLWTRRLVDVLGATSLTFSKVVGAFFAGLAIGGFMASRIRGGKPWKQVAIAEIATGLLALPVLWIPRIVASFPADLVGTPLFKLLLPLALVVPPAICMGLVTPCLLRAVYHRPAPAWVSTAVYGANILGGILGIVLLLLWSLPHFGTVTSGLGVIALNLAVAAGAAGFAWRIAVRNQVIPISPPRLPLQPRYVVVSFVSGFLVLGLEVVIQHQFAQVTINSFFSSASVLGLVLLGLGAAAFLTPAFKRLGTPQVIVCLLCGAAVLCALEPRLFLAIRPRLEILPCELTAGPYTLKVLQLGLVCVVPLMCLGGAIFPLALSQTIREGGAGRVGLLLAWNGAGGWLGAEITQYMLAPALGLWGSVIAIGMGYALLAAALARTLKMRAVAILLTGGVLAVGLANRSLPQAFLLEGERLVELRVRPEGVAATVEAAPGDWRILFNNSYTLGGSTAQFNQERQAHLPLMLHGGAKAVALLGVATGSTIAGAATHEYLARIDAFELSPSVLEFARTHFQPFNRSVFSDQRIQFFADDARWGMMGKDGEYDVVIGDLFLPWRTGEGRLFTLEHFQMVKRSLKTNGLFCQWLPMFQLTRTQFESIVHTFQQVFPQTLLLRGDFYAELPILGLVGGRELKKINWNKTAEVAAILRHSNKVSDASARHAEGLAMMIVGDLPQPPNGRLNTLDNGWLEWNAGNNILGLKEPWFVGIPYAEFVRDVQRRANPLLPEPQRKPHESGQFFLTTEVAGKIQSPHLPDLRSQIPARLPAALKEDAGIDWEQFPMGIKPDKRMF